MSRIVVPWSASESLIVFVLAWIGAPVLVVVILRLLAADIPLFGFILNAYKNGDITTSFIFAAINAAASLAIVAFYLRKYQARWHDVGWRSFNVLKAILFLAGAFILFVILATVAFVIIQRLIPAFNAHQPQVNEFTSPSTPLAKQLSLIALVLLPPIVEETVFRGFIFPALSKWKGALVGAVLTSLLFGFAHLQFNVSLYTLILSLLLCYMYYRLRSIWPGIFLHMINNYIAYMALIKK